MGQGKPERHDGAHAEAEQQDTLRVNGIRCPHVVQELLQMAVTLHEFSRVRLSYLRHIVPRIASVREYERSPHTDNKQSGIKKRDETEKVIFVATTTMQEDECRVRPRS